MLLKFDDVLFVECVVDLCDIEKCVLCVFGYMNGVVCVLFDEVVFVVEEFMLFDLVLFDCECVIVFVMVCGGVMLYVVIIVW